MSGGGALAVTLLLLAPLFFGPLIGTGDRGSHDRSLVVFAFGSGTPQLATLSGQARHPDPAPRPADRETVDRAVPTGTEDAVAEPRASVTGGAVAAESPAGDAIQADRGFTSAYQEAVRSHVQRFVYYPQGARASQIRGLVKVQFDVGRDGRLIDVWIGQSSGYDALDEAALVVVRRADPLPPIPAALPAQMEMSVPLDFVPPILGGGGRLTLNGNSVADNQVRVAGL